MPRRRWWLALTSIWVLGTLADRLWLQLDQRLPAWDQADYLNSAVDHGRALGLLPAGGWQGWDALLDLSPKIPPLASLVNGTVMAIAGDSADQASWALALWQALLLLVVGCWGRQLLGPGFGLLAASLTTLSPALAALRVDFTLDLPLAATATLALWLLGRWEAPDTEGGRWSQAIAAALAVAAAVLVKQSALLVLLAPCLWAALQGLRQRGRRLQVLVALATVLGLCLPWLRHNWITTIGGTNRAVLEAATTEGDPDPFSLASLLWYPRLLPQQLGWISLSLGLLGGSLAALQRWRQPPQSPRQSPGQTSLVLPSGWAWLIGCTLSGWLITTLSPNKDPRYLAPVLPLLVLLLAGGWWQLFVSARRRWGTPLGGGLLGIGLMAAGVSTTVGQSQAIESHEGAPIGAITAAIRRQAQDAPVTVVVVPTSKDLNQHSFTHAGRRNGGRIVGRETGKQRREHALILRQASWLLLATGDQGTKRKASRRLGAQVRSDPRFALAASWPWSEGRQLELWQRRAQAPPRNASTPASSAWPRALKRGPAALPQFLTRSVPSTSSMATSSTRSGFRPGLKPASAASPTTTKPSGAWPCWRCCRTAPSRPTAGSAASRGSTPPTPGRRPTARWCCWPAGIPGDPMPWRPRRRPGQPRSSASPCLRPSPISPEPSAADPRACAEASARCRSPLKR